MFLKCLCNKESVGYMMQYFVLFNRSFLLFCSLKSPILYLNSLYCSFLCTFSLSCAIFLLFIPVASKTLNFLPCLPENTQHSCILVPATSTSPLPYLLRYIRRMCVLSFFNHKIPDLLSLSDVGN